MTLIPAVVFAPLIVPLRLVASGAPCFRVGRDSGSARLGRPFFLLLGPLPVGVMFASMGAVAPAVGAGTVAGLIAVLLLLDPLLDRYGDDPSNPDTDHLPD
ncbi:hypothetical protein ACFWN1_12165 [Streptomyces sp. NPDC058459]|uniref:hypothetical protein n=1 Tax=Streptomyces sp. NPDC058459 TaxID=3346508 RepID=UPI00364AA071